MDGRFKRVVIWGHPLHSHTHSYIHYGFYKAFTYLGYDTQWFSDSVDVSREDFSGTLFVTEGQVDRCIPLREDCYYILHNTDPHKYPVNQVSIQVYCDVIRGRDTTDLGDGVYRHNGIALLYMPWATDLLPQEFCEPLKVLPSTSKVNWVGTRGGGMFGNDSELDPFIRSCNSQGINFEEYHLVCMEDGKNLIRSSVVAPAIVGSWQKEQGYIPCRIFKNISYGHYGITNSKAVNSLFGGRLIYRDNTAELLDAAYSEHSKQDLLGLMDYVRKNHTYLNRVKVILENL